MRPRRVGGSCMENFLRGENFLEGNRGGGGVAMSQNW